MKRETKMEKELESRLRYLRLTELLSTWDEVIAQAKSKSPSYTVFLKQIIEKECATKKERARQQRLSRAKYEEMYLFETYPFEHQPGISKKKVQEMFDSKTHLTKKQNVIFIGPTGVGKTGLATALLIDAINTGLTGRFITFPDLLSELYRSAADHSEKKVLAKFIDYDCLVIDELGYIDIDPSQAGLFFTLMKRRHKKSTTIITTQLGFKEWTGFMKNPHMTSALVDRLMENSQLLNLSKCISLRQPTPKPE